MIIEEFSCHFSRFNAHFLLLRCFQQIIKNKQAEFSCQALQTADEAPETVVSPEELEYFPREFYEKLLQALPGMVEQFPQLLNEVILILSVSCLEVFRTQCLRSILQSAPCLFDRFIEDKKRKNNKKMKQRTLNAKIQFLKPFMENVSFFSTQIGMDCVHPKFTTDSLKEIHERRHLIVHKDGIVDKKYLENTGIAQYAIGNQIQVSDEYWRRL